MIRRRTLKFWVPAERVDTMRARVMDYLPPFVYPGAQEFNGVASIYLDTRRFDLYRQRMETPDSSTLMRLRWYETPAKGPVYIELKQNRSGGLEIKRRFGIPASLLPGFLDGSASLQEIIDSATMPDDKDFIAQFATELRGFVTARELRPRVGVQARRRMFQDGEAGRIRLTLDTGVTMRHADDLNEPSWDSIPAQAHRLHWAVMEVKLATTAPPWLKPLLSDAQLISRDDFTKYGHGVAMLNPDRRLSLPMPTWVHTYMAATQPAPRVAAA